MRLAVRLAAALVLLPTGVAHATESLVELRPADLDRAARVAGVEPTGHGTDAVVDAPALASLRARGIPVRVAIADLAAQARADREADAAYAARAAQDPAGSGLPSGRTAYRHLEDYEADMDKLVAERPDLVKRVTLSPLTLQGRAIRGVEITRDVDVDGDGKPVFLQLGLHHAREWPSGEHAIEFAFELVRGERTDARLRDLLSRVRVVVVPIVNVDGFVMSREAPLDPQDAATSAVVGIVGNGSAYRRKNCRMSNGTGLTQPPISCDLTPGVDLNRNYGIHWGGNGASSQEAAPDYRGGGPFSEPESEAVRRFVRSRAVTLLITNHTSGNLVLRPPGIRSLENVPDEAGLKKLGDAFAASNGYVSQRSWELYDNSGTTEDWSYGVTGGYGYTFEIGSENFHPAYERAVVGEYRGTGVHAGRGNREAYLTGLAFAADRAQHATIEGFAPPGRVLEVRRTVTASTSPICVLQPTGFASTPCGPTTAAVPFRDEVSSRRVVGADGVVAWHVNPSESPLAGGRDTWRLTCADADGRVLERRDVPLERGASVRLELACGTPPCTAATTLRAAAVRPAGAGAVRITRAVRAGARATVAVQRVAGGDGRPVRASTALRRRPLAGDGLRVTTRALGGAGTFVVTVRAGRDVRRLALVVDERGRARRGPAFAPVDGCGELRTARLSRPVAARAGGRAATLHVRTAATARVAVRVTTAGGRTVARLAPRTVAGGRLVRLRVPTAALRRGRYAVRVTSTRGTPQASRQRSRTLGLTLG